MSTRASASSAATPAEELLGTTHRIVNSGHHPRKFWKDMWRTITSGEVWRGQVCNRAKDGSLYWVSATNIPQLDADGKIFRYISLRFDITALKEAEEKLETAARFDHLTELPNRRALLDVLEKCIERTKEDSNYRYDVLFLDFDRVQDHQRQFGSRGRRRAAPADRGAFADAPV